MPLGQLVKADPLHIIGMLTAAVASTGVQSTLTAQVEAWKQQIAILKRCGRKLINEHPSSEHWLLILEYELPRRQKRPDLVVLADDLILVVEFKVGTTDYEAAARWQVEEYCLNLRDFHAESMGRTIVPVLCATDGLVSAEQNVELTKTVSSLLFTNGHDLPDVLLRAYRVLHSANSTVIDGRAWLDSPYRPTLSVLEAAERLYENHGIREISHRYASNLDATTDRLAEVIQEARIQRKRCICFVTGVPGAGKTLTGLNVVHDPSIRAESGPSGIFLSGNGPLVKVVREALILSQKRAGKKRQEAAHEVSTFIQNVHQFLRYYRQHPQALPHEHVIVFDEAQRAWDRKHMMRKQGVDASEAAELFDVMDRFEDDWAVIIALVGGGQEIFLGEAGLEEWGRAVADRPHWQVIASPEVAEGGASVSGHRLFAQGAPPNIDFRPEPLAHLSVGVRSIRAQRLAEWVNAVLALDAKQAKELMPDCREFPFYVTRNLEQARAWLRARSELDNTQRAGLVATSEDLRLRAYGLERSSAFRRGYSYEQWFLMPPSDIRSSYSMEVAASEFECQGLELDWVGLCWGGDLTPSDQGKWEYRKFRGSAWNQVHGDAERSYIRNRYRVLLTRARLGMVIWIPSGEASDRTLDPARFNRIYELLTAAGVPLLQDT